MDGRKDRAGCPPARARGSGAGGFRDAGARGAGARGFRGADTC